MGRGEKIQKYVNFYIACFLRNLYRHIYEIMDLEDVVNSLLRRRHNTAINNQPSSRNVPILDEGVVQVAGERLLHVRHILNLNIVNFTNKYCVFLHKLYKI